MSLSQNAEDLNNRLAFNVEKAPSLIVSSGIDPTNNATNIFQASDEGDDRSSGQINFTFRPPLNELNFKPLWEWHFQYNITLTADQLANLISLQPHYTGADGARLVDSEWTYWRSVGSFLGMYSEIKYKVNNEEIHKVNYTAYELENIQWRKLYEGNLRRRVCRERMRRTNISGIMEHMEDFAHITNPTPQSFTFSVAQFGTGDPAALKGPATRLRGTHWISSDWNIVRDANNDVVSISKACWFVENLPMPNFSEGILQPGSITKIIK